MIDNQLTDTVNELEHGTAFHSNSPESSQGQCARLMQAPAKPEFGDHITVAILAESVRDQASDHLAVLAVEAIARYFAVHTTLDIPQAISAAFAEANFAIRQEIKRDSALSGKGASATITVITADRLFVGTVGATRALLVRDDQIQSISASKTWIQQASESWELTPGEIRGPVPEPVEFLGASDRVKPTIAPADFVWPGDAVLMLSSRLANRVRTKELRDILASQPPTEASAKILDLALERGGPANMTVTVIALPQARATPVTPARRVSPAVKGLILGNALLIFFIGLLLLRSGGLESVLAPAPTVEVARPIFMPTPTLVPAPELDVDPFAPTPADPLSSAVITSTPAAAPSLAPAPTFTPIPLPPGWKAPAAPVPLIPANGSFFGGPNAAVILAWEPVNNLTEDMFYVVTIRKTADGKMVGESKNWTKSTRIRLDSSFYTAMDTQPSRTGVSSPLTAAAVATFEWSVGISRLTAIAPDGTLSGVPVSPSSPRLTFVWGPSTQQAPTRTYGAEALSTDPFFVEKQDRQAASSSVISPASAGMAGLWIVIGLLAAIPKLGRSLRRTGRGGRRF